MADLTQVPWDRFPSTAGPRDQVSPNFYLYELTRSEIAARDLIDNEFPGPDERGAAVYLCRQVLQPVRDAFGRFTPNSVFRSQALERALKKKPASWTSRSQHTRAQACDIEIPGLSTLELARWVVEHLTFDQVILECYNPARGPNAGWVHVSLRPPGFGDNRAEVLSYVMDPARGKYVYVVGLQESP